MATYERAPKAVESVAKDLLKRYDTHQPLIDAGVTIDIVFAYGERDEAGNVVGDAIKHHGVKALGLAKKVPLKDRALGRADAEIILDADWWENASAQEREAVLDHEIHHFTIVIDKRGLKRDDLGRPVIKLREHDCQFGWFDIIAKRHGIHSQERQQAKSILDERGNYYWPELVAMQNEAMGTHVEQDLKSKGIDGVKVTVHSGSRFKHVAKSVPKQKVSDAAAT